MQIVSHAIIFVYTNANICEYNCHAINLFSYYYLCHPLPISTITLLSISCRVFSNLNLSPTEASLLLPRICFLWRIKLHVIKLTQSSYYLDLWLIFFSFSQICFLFSALFCLFCLCFFFRRFFLKKIVSFFFSFMDLIVFYFRFVSLIEPRNSQLLSHYIYISFYSHARPMLKKVNKIGKDRKINLTTLLILSIDYTL